MTMDAYARTATNPELDDALACLERAVGILAYAEGSLGSASVYDGRDRLDAQAQVARARVLIEDAARRAR